MDPKRDYWIKRFKTSMAELKKIITLHEQLEIAALFDNIARHEDFFQTASLEELAYETGQIEGLLSMTKKVLDIEDK